VALKKVEDYFLVGQKLMLNVQHACIIAAAYGWVFVANNNDVVQDVWFL